MYESGRQAMGPAELRMAGGAASVGGLKTAPEPGLVGRDLEVLAKLTQELRDRLNALGMRLEPLCRPATPVEERAGAKQPQPVRSQLGLALEYHCYELAQLAALVADVTARLEV